VEGGVKAEVEERETNAAVVRSVKKTIAIVY